MVSLARAATPATRPQISGWKWGCGWRRSYVDGSWNTVLLLSWWARLHRKWHRVNTSKILARSSCDTALHLWCKFFTDPLGCPWDLPGLCFRFDNMAVSPPDPRSNVLLSNPRGKGSVPLLSVSCFISYLAKDSWRSTIALGLRTFLI
jgi:hypothetical protein